MVHVECVYRLLRRILFTPLYGTVERMRVCERVCVLREDSDRMTRTLVREERYQIVRGEELWHPVTQVLASLDTPVPALLL